MNNVDIIFQSGRNDFKTEATDVSKVKIFAKCNWDHLMVAHQ